MASKLASHSAQRIDGLRAAWQHEDAFRQELILAAIMILIAALLPVTLIEKILLVGVVVGGLASIPGAIFGGIFIQFVPNIADEMSKSAPAAIYGILLIGFMYLLPMGVMGGVYEAWARFRARSAG